MSRLRRWFPVPLLSTGLLIVWVMLTPSMSAGQMVLGLILAIVIPYLTIKLIPERLQLRRPGLAVRYVLRVIGDVVASNLAVGFDVVRWRQPAHRLVRVPLELRDPLGLAALAMVTTIVPGTVWSELAVDRSSLLLHVWDVDEEASFIARYKARYEQPLREIFE